MTAYYELEPHYLEDYGIRENPDLDIDDSFCDGKWLAGPLPEMRFRGNFPTGYKLPHLTGNIVPLVSEQLLQAFRDVGVDNFQSFPAIIVNPETGEEWRSHSAFNVLGILRAADMGASEFDELMGGDPSGSIPPLVAFNRLVIDGTKTHGLMLFRLEESPSTMIVHETVVNHLKANRPSAGWKIDVTKLNVT